MGNNDIIKEIILFENEKDIYVENSMVYLDNYKNKYHDKIQFYSNKFTTNDSCYYARIFVYVNTITFDICDGYSKELLKEDYDNKLNICIDNYNYDRKIKNQNDWCFRVFSEDFNIENFKKIINLKKYVNNKYINNLKNIKPDLFIKYH